MQAYGMWLSTFRWAWFATFTFGESPKDVVIEKRVHDYFDAVSRRSSDSTYLAYCIESARWTGGKHVHALLGNTGNLRPRCSSQLSACMGCGTHLWKHGFAMVKEFNPKLPGLFYMVKTLAWGDGKVEILGTPESLNDSILGRTVCAERVERGARDNGSL